MKISAEQGGCYPQRPKAEVDNTLRDLQNSSHPTKAEFNNCFIIHSKYFPVLKAGVHMKAVFWLGIMFFMQISCLRFKQSRISLLISHIYVLGCFGNFLVIFRYIWREIVFLKGLVKLMEIGNFEDLLLF